MGTDEKTAVADEVEKRSQSSSSLMKLAETEILSPTAKEDITYTCGNLSSSERVHFFLSSKFQKP